MTGSHKTKRTYSAEALERMRIAALARYDSEAAQAHARVREVMKVVQKETAGNAGIYPRNKGAVSMAEVARRAQIHPFTFHKPRYKELAKEVKTWLETLKEGAVIGRGRARTELGTRIGEWKQLYDDLLETHRVCVVDLEHTQELLREALQENERLRQRHAEQAKLKVVPVRPTTNT